MQSNLTGKEFTVEVIAFADGASPTTVRTCHNSIIELEKDLVLLYSPKSLHLTNFPTPTRYHQPPNQTTQTSAKQDIHLLSYNGCPSARQLRDYYPNTPTALLHTAVSNLWIDRLSYATGQCVATINGGIIHRISSLAGSSGGPLMNDAGEILGTSSCAFC
jgi:hypothetical protein